MKLETGFFFSCSFILLLFYHDPLKGFYLQHGDGSEQCCYRSCRKLWHTSSEHLILVQESCVWQVTELLLAGVSALWFSSSVLQESLGRIPQQI